MKMKFKEGKSFEKDWKRLIKKYSSLPVDLQIFKSVLIDNPLGNRKHFHVITKTETIHIIKARFFSRYLRKSSLRIVYSYAEELDCIEFIELYFKGAKSNHDQARIDSYLATMKS
jgi:hypothetical protein